MAMTMLLLKMRMMLKMMMSSVGPRSCFPPFFGHTFVDFAYNLAFSCDVDLNLLCIHTILFSHQSVYGFLAYVVSELSR